MQININEHNGEFILNGSNVSLTLVINSVPQLLEFLKKYPKESSIKIIQNDEVEPKCNQNTTTEDIETIIKVEDPGQFIKDLENVSNDAMTELKHFKLGKSNDEENLKLSVEVKTTQTFKRLTPCGMYLISLLCLGIFFGIAYLWYSRY